MKKLWTWLWWVIAEPLPQPWHQARRLSLLKLLVFEVVLVVDVLVMAFCPAWLQIPIWGLGAAIFTAFVILMIFGVVGSLRPKT